MKYIIVFIVRISEHSGNVRRNFLSLQIQIVYSEIFLLLLQLERLKLCKTNMLIIFYNANTYCYCIRKKKWKIMIIKKPKHLPRIVSSFYIIHVHTHTTCYTSKLSKLETLS